MGFSFFSFSRGDPVQQAAHGDNNAYHYYYYYIIIIIIKRGLKKVRVTRTSYEYHDSYMYLFIYLFNSIQFSQLTLTLDLEKPGLICNYNLLL